MKRAPLVLAGTAAGLAGVLAYNTAPVSSVIASTSGATTATTTTAAARASTTTSSAKAASTPTTTSSSAAKAARSAVGQDVSFQYGDLQVKVSEKGSRITGISIARVDVTDPRSQGIDEAAIPELTREALAAQSAHVDGVSGASYTSAAYEQSLQSALDKLA